MSRIPNHRTRRGKPKPTGDHLMICDRTGRTIKASDARQEWNGLWVHKSVWEPKHPQLMVRGKTDDQTVEPARPEATDVEVEVTRSGGYDEPVPSSTYSGGSDI